MKNYEDFEVSEIAKQLNALFPRETAEKLAFAYLFNGEEDLSDLLKLSEIKCAISKKPFIPSPTPEESSGDIILGRILNCEKELHPFCISLEDINRHLAIFSSTGMGKTTLIINILLQLLNREKPIPFLATDWKRDFRHLTRSHDLWVLRWNWLKVNFLQPPQGVSKKQWMMIVADIFAHVFGFFSASENYMMQFMNQLYKRHKEYPTLQELFDAIDKTEEKSRRYIEYQDVVRNRLASMLIVFGDVVDCRQGFPIEELLEHPVIIELDGLRRDEANFLVEWLLAYIFAYRIANGHRGKLKHVIVFDEATRLFYRKREWSETTIELGFPFIETVPQIIRDYGEGIIFALQEPSIASHSLMANTNVKIVGFLGEGQDIDAIVTSLDLDEKERSALAKLERGEWLVKKAGMEPFLMRSFDYPLEKEVTNKELEERMKPILSRLNMKLIPSSQQTRKEVSKPQLPFISEDAKKLLYNVNKHPFKGLSSHYAMLEFSGRKAENAKNELIKKGFVKEVSISLGSHRPVKFLALTNLGVLYLKNEKQETRLWEFIGNASFEHRLYQVLIAYSFKNSGHQAYIEKEVSEGKRLDVLAIQDKKRIGIEIELNPNLDLGKILKSLKDLDELKIVCSDKAIEKVKETIKRVVYPSLQRKISICSVKEYLANLKGNIKVNRDGKNSDF